jgi:hypothetical protein
VIYWQLIKDWDSACKMISYMTWQEYEDVLHNLRKFDVDEEKRKLLKKACRHHCHLRKLSAVTARSMRENKVKVRYIMFKGELDYVEAIAKDKRICGCPIKGMPAGYFCLRNSGAGTNHRGYGFCSEHERMNNSDDRRKLWIKLKQVHGNVPALKTLVERAEKIEDIAVKTMDADLSYIEIARQAIMQRIEAVGGVPLREHTDDLVYLSEVSAKVKALKVKTEAVNWIAPDQVIAIIMQVMDAVTKGESDEVRRRIASRAKDIGGILVPRIQSDNPEIPDHRANADVKRALIKAGEYIEEGKQFADIPEVTGYEIPDPTKPKPVPNYKKNHRFLRRDAEP